MREGVKVTAAAQVEAYIQEEESWKKPTTEEDKKRQELFRKQLGDEANAAVIFCRWEGKGGV